MFISCIVFLFLIYIFKFNLDLLVTKNFTHFFYQFLKFFIIISTSTGLITHFNWPNTFSKIHNYWIYHFVYNMYLGHFPYIAL